MKRIPPFVAAHHRTREFTESTVPPGLLRRHTTKRGVWGRIQILEGSLLYRILEPSLEEHVLTPERPGVVSPEIPHEVKTIGTVRTGLLRAIQRDSVKALPIEMIAAPIITLGRSEASK